MAKLGLDEQEPDTRPAQWGNPVQNIPAISGILGSRGILFHCDAAQAPCAMDMGKLAAHADLNQSHGEMRRWWGSNDGAGSFSKNG